MNVFASLAQSAGNCEYILEAMGRRRFFWAVLLIWVACFPGSHALRATVTAVSVQAPSLAGNGLTSLTSPVHFQATAESDLSITGYVIYVDDQNVYQNSAPLLDAFVVLSPGVHYVYVKAWDSSGSLASTATYGMSVSSFAPPPPPPGATRRMRLSENASRWVVDNDPGVGGNCNDGSMAPFPSSSDPNTTNSPDAPRGGLHLVLASKCQYDDSLFYLKDTSNPSPYAGDTNFLWDFWFYIPTTTQTANIQALESDFFQALQLSDGVHEFMFGSQCNYGTNQWQLWLPQNGSLTWVNAGVAPCEFSNGAWHHATYFLQRVTPSGYQKIPANFDPSSDTNTSLRFGTLTIDGNTVYLGALSNSTVPNSGVTIEEYVDKESLTAW